MLTMIEQPRVLPARISEKIEAIYDLLCDYLDQEGLTPMGNFAPFVGEISEKLYHELCTEERLELVQAAIQRHDEELFGYPTREEFVRAVMMGDFTDHTLEPDVQLGDVISDVQHWLHSYQIFHAGYGGRLCHAPIVEVW